MRLYGRDDYHAASIYFPRVDVSCNVNILHYFIEMPRQFFEKILVYLLAPLNADCYSKS